MIFLRNGGKTEKGRKGGSGKSGKSLRSKGGIMQAEARGSTISWGAVSVGH